MTAPQLDLFAAPPALPGGVHYARDVISPAEEGRLVSFIETLRVTARLGAQHSAAR